MAWAEYYRQQVAFYGQTLGQAQAHSQVCSRSSTAKTSQANPDPPPQFFCVCLTLGPEHRGNRVGPGTAQHGRRLQSTPRQPPWPPPRPRQDRFEPSGRTVWAEPLPGRA